MQHRNRIERLLNELPMPGLLVSLSVIMVTWLFLFAYDVVLKGASSPESYGFLRTLLPLAGLTPALVRILRIELSSEPQEIYNGFVRLTTTLLILVGLTTLLNLLPLNYSSSALPNSFFASILGHMAALGWMIALPLIAEGTLRSFSYQSKGGGSMLLTLYRCSLVLLVVMSQLLPLDRTKSGVAFNMLVYVIAGLTGWLGFSLSFKVGWIINLRKQQKAALLGLSFIGFPAAAGLLFHQSESDIGLALLSFAPSISALGFAEGISLLFLSMVIFVTALFAIPTAGAIDRRNAEVSSLANFARLLTQSLNIDELVDTAISISCDATGCTSGWIEIGTRDHHEILYSGAHPLPAHVASKLMYAPLGNGTALRDDVFQHHRIGVVDSVRGVSWNVPTGTQQHLRSVAAAPLRLGEKFLGTLYLAKAEANGFDRDDTVVLAALADQIALAIEHSRLIQSSIERERLDQEMLIAYDLQQRLLPSVMPQSPFYQIHAESVPASIVGGDYYDVVSFSDQTIGVLVADVSGKGASAALYMGMIKGIIQALSGKCESPRELLAQANVALHGNIDRRWFATMTCAQIIDERRILRITRAGHCPTLLIRGGIGCYSNPRGIGLAIAKPRLFDSNLEIEEVSFASGDYAVFISDGLPEARSASGDEFGYERLLEVATQAAQQGLEPQAMRDSIFQAIAAFSEDEPQHDDSTLVILRWR